MTIPDNIRINCDAIDSLTQAIRDELLLLPDPNPPDPPSDVDVVPEGGDLQAALDDGGVVVLAAEARFSASGGYDLLTPRTLLAGEGGNVISGGTSPALIVPPGKSEIAIGQVRPETTGEVAVLLGRNDSQQVTVESAPRLLRLQSIASSGHRGKRVVEVNARDVLIVNADIRDAYDPEGQDSQAICILNAPGPVTVEGGHLEAGSEVIMVGGDAMKIPNCRPTGLIFRKLVLTRPMAWRDAGTPKVKNLLELKDGYDVLIEECELSNCWPSAQDGYGFMFTPTRGGSLRNVVVRACTMREVAGIMNITGVDADAVSSPRTQIALYGGDYATNPALGGRGCFALIGRGPESVVVEDARIQHHGSSFIDCSDKSAIDLLSIVGCAWNYGSYGIRIGGVNHGDNSAGIIASLIIEGNTITGAHSSFKSRYPNNTYVDAYREDSAHRLAIEWDDTLRRARGLY